MGMRYRAYRSDFSQKEYDHHAGMFWAMPAAWGEANTGATMLRQLRAQGGVGALALLPILGRYAFWKKSGSTVLSFEECARLAGCDQDSIRRGSVALAELELATTAHTRRYGRNVTTWNIRPTIAATMRSGRLEAASFRFDSRVVYGGAWAMLTASQKAAYLGAATRAFTCREKDDLEEFLDHALDAGAHREDIREPFRQSSTGAKGTARLAIASVAELAAITGVSETALHGAIKGLKRIPMMLDTNELRYAPLAVYAGRPGHPNVFVFRDHAEPWPWSVLNARSSGRTAA